MIPKPLTPEQRVAFEKKTARIVRRCHQCGRHADLFDGSEITDGMPGIVYRVCNSCGHSQAIQKRQGRVRL